MRQPALSLLIPTYNESEIIVSSLREIAKALDPKLVAETEVIVVDDGTDSLPEAVEAYKAESPFLALQVWRNSPGIGKGRSVALGFTKASAAIVGFLDVDLSTSPSYIPQAYQIIQQGKADIFIASRRAKGAVVTRKQFFLKDVLGYVLGVLARSFIFAGMRSYSDTQCGFKFFRRELTQVLYEDLVAPDGLNDLEMLLRANMLRLRVHEQGVVWTDIRESKRSLRRILIGELKSFVRICYRYKVCAFPEARRLRRRVKQLQ